MIPSRDPLTRLLSIGPAPLDPCIEPHLNSSGNFVFEADERPIYKGEHLCKVVVLDREAKAWRTMIAPQTLGVVRAMPGR